MNDFYIQCLTTVTNLDIKVIKSQSHTFSGARSVCVYRAGNGTGQHAGLEEAFSKWSGIDERVL